MSRDTVDWLEVLVKFYKVISVDIPLSKKGNLLLLSLNAFFLSFAQPQVVSCGVLVINLFNFIVCRVDGMMMNSGKFVESFKCSPTSRMNPVKKCSKMFGR